MDLHHRIDFLSNGALGDGVKSSKILQTHEEIVRLLKDRELSDEHNRELLKSLEKVVSKNTSIQNMENYKLYLRYAHLKKNKTSKTTFYNDQPRNSFLKKPYLLRFLII